MGLLISLLLISAVIASLVVGSIALHKVNQLLQAGSGSGSSTFNNAKLFHPTTVSGSPVVTILSQTGTSAPYISNVGVTYGSTDSSGVITGHILASSSQGEYQLHLQFSEPFTTPPNSVTITYANQDIAQSYRGVRVTSFDENGFDLTQITDFITDLGAGLPLYYYIVL